MTRTLTIGRLLESFMVEEGFPPEVVLLETRTPEKEGRMDGGKIGRYIARTVNYVIL